MSEDYGMSYNNYERRYISVSTLSKRTLDQSKSK